MSFIIKPRTRTKVQCFCDKCEGELVDPRTKTKHEELMTRKINNGRLSGLPDEMVPDEMGDIEMYDNGQEAGPSELPGLPDEMREVDNNRMDDDAMELPERNYNFLTKKLPMHESAKYQSVKKGKISNRVLENLLLDDDNAKWTLR
jgi:hypothetical protein